MRIFEYFVNFIIGDCSICCEKITLNQKSCKTKCNHIFHYVCLSKWSQQLMIKKRNFNCPLCRTDLAK